jgi:hypothetical protein
MGTAGRTLSDEQLQPAAGRTAWNCVLQYNSTSGGSYWPRCTRTRRFQSFP